MKQFYLTFLLLASTAFTLMAAPQGPVTASITDQMQIILPADQSLAAEYVVDITGKFKSAAALENFCNSFRDMGITYRGDFETGKLYIMPTNISDSTGKVWDVTRWNEYFAGRAPKMMVFAQSVE